MGRRGKRPSRFQKWFYPVKESVSNRWAQVRNILSGKHRRRQHLGQQQEGEQEQTVEELFLESAGQCKKKKKRKLFKKFGAKINKKMHKVPVVFVVAEPQYRVVAGEYQIVNVLPMDSVYDVEDDILERPRTPENYEETFGYFEHIRSNRQQLIKATYKLGDGLILGVIPGDRETWKKFVIQTQRDVKAWKEKCRQSDRLYKETGKILGVEEGRIAAQFHNRAKRYIRDRVEPVKERVTQFIQERVDQVQEFRAERKRQAELRASQPSDFYTPAEFVSGIVTPIRQAATEVRGLMHLNDEQGARGGQGLGAAIRARLRKYFGGRTAKQGNFLCPCFIG